jgi:hypothetical protein
MAAELGLDHDFWAPITTLALLAGGAGVFWMLFREARRADRLAGPALELARWCGLAGTVLLVAGLMADNAIVTGAGLAAMATLSAVTAWRLFTRLPGSASRGEGDA